MVTFRRTLLGFLAAAALAATGFQGRAMAFPVDARDVRLDVEVEAGSGNPHVGEMIIVSVKGSYGLKIALEQFEPTELQDFTWLQLGRDAWSPSRGDGRDAVTLERRLALYPRRPGKLTIGPFRHHLTLVSRTGERFAHEVASNAVTVTVAPRPEAARSASGAWWLPAQAVTLSDEWDMDPSRLADDATATRTVTITARGLPAEALPPPPLMREPGLISFIAPEERSTVITQEGPVGTVRWQWRMRPATSEPSRLPAVAIPWFDTNAREMREVVLPSRRVAFASIEEPTVPEGHAGGSAWIATLGIGLILPPAFALLGRRISSPRTLLENLRPLLPDRDTIAMRLAVWQNDPAAYRRHLNRRCRTLALPFPTARTTALDSHLFGAASATLDLLMVHRGLRPSHGAPPPDPVHTADAGLDRTGPRDDARRHAVAGARGEFNPVLPPPPPSDPRARW